MTEDQSSLGLPGTEPGQPVIRIFGVGNAGLKLLDGLATPEFAGAELVAVNTDGVSLAASAAPTRIQLENARLRGLGSGGDPERCQQLAEEQFSLLKNACEGADVVLLLAGLGGGAGSGVTPILAKAAREAGALVLGFVMLPFEYEGNRRAGQARQSLNQLKLVADGVICLPGMRAVGLIHENTPVIELFPLLDGFILEAVRGVWQLLTRPGLIQVHYGDLCALVRNRHTESSFACVEAAGAARAREVVEKLLAHQLLDAGKALEQAEAVLVSITAGRDLTMSEVNRVMEQMRRHCGQAQIIMGAAIDAAFQDRLCVTVIAAHANPHPAVASVDSLAPRANDSTPATAPATVPVGSRPAPARRTPGSKKMVQPQLPLTVISKGRFDQSAPTIHHGENLDEPTYLRLGVSLN